MNCYCNRAQHLKYQRKLKPCERCNKPIVSYTNSRFCSRACSTAELVGPKAPRWKDGSSLIRERAKVGYKLSLWRKKVFKRDYYTCQQCSKKGELHAHHIKSFADYPKLRFSISNGVTLCIHCHGKVHGKDFTTRNKTQCKSCKTLIKSNGKTGLCRSCFLDTIRKT